MSGTAPKTGANSRAVTSFVAANVAAGAVVFVASAIRAVHTPHPLGWLALSLIAIVTGSFRLTFASGSANIAIDDTFFITTALLFGPGPATLAIAASGLLLSLQRRRSWTQVAFNTASLALSMWVAAETFFLIAGVPPLADTMPPAGGLVLPLVALALVYYLLNSGLTAVVVGLDTHQSPIQIWRRHFLWLSIGYFAAASLAFCLILLMHQASVLTIFVLAPLLFVFHLTLRSSFGRLEDAQRHLRDMDRLYLSTIETLAMAIDAKDDVTHSHVRRVQAYAVGLARALGIDDEPTLKAIEAAALLHDTGKLAVPEYILNKPGKLTTAEFERMKTHVDVGAGILSLVQFPFPVVPIVQCHHENWDGSGYPRGVAREAIPIGARILSVVDCFDALTSDRPYRRAMTDEAALGILRERSGTMYDPRIVATFIRVYRDIPIESAVATEHRPVLQLITDTRQEIPSSGSASDAAADVAASCETSLLPFVSLARIASGDAALDDVLLLASKLLSDAMSGVTGAWYTPDLARDRMVVAQAFGPAGHTLRGVSAPIGGGLTGWVAASRQPIVNSDASLDLGAKAELATPPLRNCMSVPVVAGDALVAVVSLYRPEPDAFTEDHRRSIQMIAPHVAAAIQSASKRGHRDLRLVASR